MAATRERSAHEISIEEVAARLSSDPVGGLAESEARSRLAAAGPNEIPQEPVRGFGSRLWAQVSEPMALLLLSAALISGIALREPVDAVAIAAIVVLNAVIALVQEGRAERALNALREMTTAHAVVTRGGRVARIDSKEVVEGDLVVLAAGDQVPADLRLVLANGLQIDESALTGESLAVEKSAGPVADPDAAVADRTSMAHSGTHVTRGSGTGIAVATGARTELGRIAAALAGERAPTPLQVELAHVTSRLAYVAVTMAAIAFAISLARAGQGVQEAFLAAVALAVAAVPEGLATVVTVALALGVRRMATQGAIVRRLPAVETLGSTTVILTDKTGTLTENRMRFERLVSGAAGEPSLPGDDMDERVLRALVLCNDANLDPPGGDPTEIALLEPFSPSSVGQLRSAYPRIAEIPFDSERKRMVTLHRTGDGFLLIVKGAPETVIESCSAVAEGSGRAMAAEERASLLELSASMASQGYRLLALAQRELTAAPPKLEEAEAELTFLGLVGLRDPLRATAADTVARAGSAGIQILMVTGDHPGTAAAVAGEAGIARGPRVMTGRQLDEALPEDPLSVRVYARVDPAHKLALVRALKDAGHVVAVTGDGVNDAPALKHADIGVAMGLSGTDVARDASDMVITDDDLATVVAAVHEGRSIYDNIRKVVEYLVAANLSEIAVVIICLLAFPELGVPLLPLQLLWINLVTDGFPAIALGLDPADPHLMERPPRDPATRLLNAGRLERLALRGLLLALASIGVLALTRYWFDASWAESRGAMFSALACSQLVYAFSVRKPAGWRARREGYRATMRLMVANRWLMGAVGLGIVLQVAVMTFEPVRGLFDVHAIGLGTWGLVAAAAVLPAFLVAVVVGYRTRS